MNKYKITLTANLVGEIVEAERIEYKKGFVLFYIGSELIISVFQPLAVVRK